MKLDYSRVVGVAAALATLGGFALNGAAAAGGFSLASLNGSYAAIFSGEVPNGSGSLPMLGTGVFIADGKGHLRGRETYTLGTAVCEAKVSGTYRVEPDGRGTAALDFTALTKGCASGSYTQSLVIARRGSLVLLANTNGQRIEEEWHRQ
ncbi:MAG TPA: hypothetical protein VGR91_12040 [Stellaceae bacterium]|nr:hypothetical protein [Stellaceae bacterium]